MTVTDPDQIRRDIERTRGELSSDVDALARKASPGRMLRDRRDRATGGVRRLRDRVMGTVAEAGDATGRASSAVGDAATQAPAKIRETAEGNPLAAGLVAFGLGWLVSSLLPASRTEQRVAEQIKDVAAEHGEDVKREVGAVAGELREHLQEPAADAVDSVRSTASDAARTVAEDARGQVSG